MSFQCKIFSFFIFENSKCKEKKEGNENREKKEKKKEKLKGVKIQDSE